jgi:CheY-like chemotaxis protein
MFFYVKAEEFAPRALLNGVPDEWFIVPPFDSQQLASRILRRVFNIKAGREGGNRACLAPYLESFKKFASAGGEPLIAPPPTPPVAAKIASAAAPPALPRKRVLIVDDDRHLVEAICEVLRGRDLELFKAYSGFQGVQVATREVPDLIVTDFEMPNGSAEYLISNLRQSDSTRPIKVIVMTGHEVIERYQLSRNPASYLKVVSYQPKPIDIDNLCGEVRRHLAAA